MRSVQTSKSAIRVRLVRDVRWKGSEGTVLATCIDKAVLGGSHVLYLTFMVKAGVAEDEGPRYAYSLTVLL